MSACLAFTFQGRARKRASFSGLSMKDDKPERKDLGRVLQQTLFPNIYTSYEDTVNAGGKKAIKITTETGKAAAQPRKSFYDMKGDNSKIRLGEYIAPDIPDEKAYEKTISKTKQIKKPANFKPSKPSSLKLVPATGPGSECLPGSNTFPKPKKPLILYETEGNSDCRKVREVLSALDIPVIVKPCPSGRYGWSDDQARITNGERTLPFLIDPGSMYQFNLRGSKEITPYLFENYGPGADNIPKNLAGSGGKGGGGKLAKNARVDFIKIKPVTLYMFEGCKACDPVRKTLEGLGISHKIIFCAKGSKNRAAIEKKFKTFQVPYLVDPNTKCDLFESKDIVNYLNEVYGT